MKLRNLSLFLLLAIVGTMTSFAQQIPVDKEVRIGKLDNGLTYYIRHNNWPENVANFYIAQRVGSVQENEDQRGLAHFLEHMAFNGSEHFKGNNIIEYTRSLGVEFGSNLNAYTGFDETVYNINDVPAKRVSALDSCLLILKDWSNGLLLEEEEIDKERGVIHEEWRLRSSAMQRMQERALPQMYPGSKYGQRMPIGLMEVVDNFKPKALRDYYHKWYRPDNQAIIVVGDIDVDHVEAEIKKLFGGIVVPKNAAQVIDEPVPDNKEAIYVCEKDKEQQMTMIMVFMKHDVTPREEKTKVDYLMQDYVTDMIENMFDKRMEELSLNPDCPFVQAGAGDGQYFISKTKDAFTAIVVPKDGKDLEALASVIKELKRAKEFGFTATEYERARADYLSMLEKRYTGRNKINNDKFGRAYAANFTDGEPILSVEDEYEIMNNMIVPNIPVDIINMVAAELISENDENLVVACFEQEKDGKTYLQPAQLKTTFEKARAEKVEPYVDNVKNEPLVDETKLPAPGTITAEKENKTLGYKELTLSNGAKVILKKTDFKDDEVMMEAEAIGGTSLYGEADYSNLKLLSGAIEMSGLGNFTHSELEKALAGKVAGVGAEFDVNSTSLSGKCVPKDLETMMQLTYLYFTNINKDEQGYNQLTNILKVALQNKSLSPESAFSDSLIVTMYNNNPRMKTLEVSDLDKANYDRMLEIGRELLKNPGAFTYIFTGNFDETLLREYICKYIGSLKGNEVLKSYDVTNMATGNIKNSFKRKMETPKAIAIFTWWSEAPYNLENSVLASAAGQVLEMYYLKTIREEASAAYTCGASGKTERVLDRQFVSMLASCPMNPEKAETALKLMDQGIAEASQKVDPEIVSKVKEYMLKQANEDAKKNGHWTNILSQYVKYGIDFQTDYKKTVEALTAEKISAFIKNVILKDNNHMEVIMMPEETKTETTK